MKDKTDKNVFIEIVSKSHSKADVIRGLGLKVNGRSCENINKLIKEYECDTSHFDSARNRRKYNIVEKICPMCGIEFKTTNGCRKRDKKCCSRKCANIMRSGKLHHNWRVEIECLNCGNKCKKNATRFCSKQCFGKYQRKKTFEKIENGTFKSYARGNGENQQLKLYLIEKNGYKCMVCDNTKWMGQPIPLQVDHKDGNSDNDKVENIRNICPNCHAQTKTYCGKNKGKGKRKHRLEDYRKGKKKW